jgi:hypothetical protein
MRRTKMCSPLIPNLGNMGAVSAPGLWLGSV